MASLGVPQRYRQPLRALAELPQDQADRFIDAVRQAAPLLKVAELEQLFREALGDAPPPADPEWVVAALLSLRGRLREFPLERVVEAASTSRDLEIATEAQDTFRARLRALLDTDALSSTANAVELLTQNERNYGTARILTDVRHVFREEASERPLGAVIIEVLAIQTWDKNGDEETIHIAMDESDLHELLSATKRALDKTENIRGMLTEQKVTYFELDKREI